MTVFTTTPFRLTPSVYFRIAAGRSMPRIALLLAIPFIVLIAVGVLYDARFLFIALMVPFIFAPIVISHIFYSTLLHPDARRSLRLQQAILLPDDSLELQFLEECKTDCDNNSEQTNQADNPPLYRITDSTKFGKNDITGITLTARCLVFNIKGSGLPVAIPLSSLPDAFNPYDIIDNR